MLRMLLESGAVRERRPGGTLVSVVAHTAIIGAVVTATAVGDEPAGRERVIAETIIYQAPAPTEPPPPTGGGPASGEVGALREPTIPLPTAPPIDLTRIPVGIPEGTLDRFDLRRPDPGNGAQGLRGLDPRGVLGSGGAGFTPGSVLDEGQVERVAQLLTAVTPRYPDRMRAMGLEGRVVVQFVIDTAGRVEAEGVRVLEATHEEFAVAARQTLSRLRFRAAEAGGRRVRMLAAMPFEFRLAGRD